MYWMKTLTLNAKSVSARNSSFRSKKQIAEIEQKQLKVVVSVCNLMDVTIEDLYSRNRNRKLSSARGICFYLFYNQLGLTYQEIGEIFNLNRCTVYEKVQDIDIWYQKKWYPDYTNVIDAINYTFTQAA